LIEPDFVPEYGGEGVGRFGGAGSTVEKEGDDGEGVVELLGAAAEVSDGGGVAGGAALGAVALEAGERIGGAEEVDDAGVVLAGGAQERRRGNGAACGDGVGCIALPAGLEHDLEEGGGDALGLGALLDEHCSCNDSRIERLRREDILEAGVATVLEGVEVAGSGARSGATAAAAGPRLVVRGRDEVSRGLHGGWCLTPDPASQPGQNGAELAVSCSVRGMVDARCGRWREHRERMFSTSMRGAHFW